MSIYNLKNNSGGTQRCNPFIRGGSRMVKYPLQVFYLQTIVRILDGNLVHGPQSTVHREVKSVETKQWTVDHGQLIFSPIEHQTPAS